MGEIQRKTRRTAYPGILFAVCFLVTSFPVFGADSVVANPIGRLARVFNPKLVKVETRVEFLRQQLISLAAYEDHALKNGLGVRGARIQKTDPDPSFTVDLGKSFAIDTVYLVPLQEEFSGKKNLFPRKFSIKLSDTEDFQGSHVLYSSGGVSSFETTGLPVRFTGKGVMGRYVRLTVQQGQMRGDSEIFGISEMVVISDRYPVSFGCDVTAVGALNSKDIWYPAALTDGRMPIGDWQGGDWVKKDERGDIVEVDSLEEEVFWTLDLGEEKTLDLVVLFPFDVRETLEAGLLPEALELQVSLVKGGEFTTVESWVNPISGSNHETPLLFKLGGIPAREFRIKGIRPRVIGGKFLYGLSEIQLWSDQKNISGGINVQRGPEKVSAELSSLTNGYNSGRQLIPVGSWLSQLYDRSWIEREINALQPMREQMAAESELNATWGTAMVLGLTFLIPVFIVERRRLISSKQVDKLRKRIASDLHDDIGSNLGSISLIARTARKDLIRLHGPPELGADLDEVESIARESSLAMRDIVWLLERKQDSIGDLVHRMRETASRLLREFEYTIECDSSKTAAKLSLDSKRHLFLFYKEAIHNILKHSKATVVSIRLWDKGDKLLLQIVDNGQGIPKMIVDDKEVEGLVRKLDDRARVLEGTLDMKSEKGKGTTILLTVRRSLLVSATPMK